MNLFTHYSEYLGHTTLRKWIVCWFFAVIIPTSAWHISQSYTTIGIIVVGISPFAALFFFLIGLNAAARVRMYLLTALKAKKLGLNPTWGSGTGGYLLIDDIKHLWAANGHGGHLSDITEIQTDSTDLAHTISIVRPHKRDLIIGFDSESDLAAMHEHFLASLSLL